MNPRAYSRTGIERPRCSSQARARHFCGCPASFATTDRNDAPTDREAEDQHYAGADRTDTPPPPPRNGRVVIHLIPPPPLRYTRTQTIFLPERVFGTALWRYSEAPYVENPY